MRATLSFTLPDEEIEHRNAVDAGKAFSLLHQIKERIRSRLKYGEPDKNDWMILEEIQSDMYEAFPDLDER